MSPALTLPPFGFFRARKSATFTEDFALLVFFPFAFAISCLPEFDGAFNHRGDQRRSGVPEQWAREVSGRGDRRLRARERCGLEEVAHCELNLALGVGARAGDPAEVRVTDKLVRLTVLRGVKHVEPLDPELEITGRPQAEGLEQRKVERPVSRPHHGIALGRALRSGCCAEVRR